MAAETPVWPKIESQKRLTPELIRLICNCDKNWVLYHSLSEKDIESTWHHILNQTKSDARILIVAPPRLQMPSPFDVGKRKVNYISFSSKSWRGIHLDNYDYILLTSSPSSHRKWAIDALLPLMQTEFHCRIFYRHPITPQIEGYVDISATTHPFWQAFLQK